MSRIREADTMESRITDAAITARGFILRLLNTGHVTLAGADQAFCGVAYTDTKIPVSAADGSLTYTATASLPVSIQRVGAAVVQVLATNAAIAIGRVIQTAAGGTVDLFTPAGATPTGVELDSIVGIALDAVAINTGGTIRAWLSPMVGTVR